MQSMNSKSQSPEKEWVETQTANNTLTVGFQQVNIQPHRNSQIFSTHPTRPRPHFLQNLHRGVRVFSCPRFTGFLSHPAWFPSGFQLAPGVIPTPTRDSAHFVEQAPLSRFAAPAYARANFRMISCLAVIDSPLPMNRS